MKDILDLLPEKELSIIEQAAYDLLHKHGYNVRGARKDGRVRARLKRALERRGHELVYLCAEGEERGVYKLSFALRAIDGDVIDRSKTFRVVFGGRNHEDAGTDQ
jgi:hypothetical protein